MIGKKLVSGLIVLGLGAYVAGAASPARADVSNLASSKYWTAFGGTATDNARVCGINTSGKEFYVAMKFFENDPENFEFAIIKESWRIPANKKIPVSLVVDRNQPWQANASPYTDGPAAGKGMTFLITFSDFAKFVDELKSGAKLKITFPDGNEPNWNLSLSGISDVLNSLVGCIKVIAPNFNQSQPYSKRGGSVPETPTTQPF